MSINTKKYDEWFCTPFGAYADRLEKSLIFRYLGDVRGKRILDLGCGTGNYAIELARRGAIVTGIDASMDMLDTAMEKAKAAGLQIAFLEGRAEEMPLKAGSFDALVSVTACEFFGDMRMAAGEMKRVIKPDGKIVIGTINKLSLYGVEKKISSIYKKESSYRNARFNSIFEMRRFFDVIKWKTTIFALPWMPKRVLAVFEKSDLPLSLFLKPCGAFLAIEARN
jgi:ubiquinone/menaquinone biosynthesis C-methylase UbiE